MWQMSPVMVPLGWTMDDAQSGNAHWFPDMANSRRMVVSVGRNIRSPRKTQSLRIPSIRTRDRTSAKNIGEQLQRNSADQPPIGENAMSKQPFFTEGSSGRAYANVMAASNEWTKRARLFCDDLWDAFAPHADPDFLSEVRVKFDERFWEMYLTVTLIRLGHQVTCPKPGPDVGITVDGMRIWFEAVSPSRGADGSPDQVPEVHDDGRTQSVPNQQMILRYLNSISEKYERQYPNWLRSSVVSKDDAFVIALNPRRLGFDYADTIPPRILQAAFPVGNAFIKFYRDNLKPRERGFEVRPSLAKASGSLVDTGVFLHAGYEALSGLLVSRVDVVNRPECLGDDFQLLPNPVATAPLPPGLRLPGTYFTVSATDDGFNVRPETSAVTVTD